MNQWISVKDDMPVIHDHVLCCDTQGSMIVCKIGIRMTHPVWLSVETGQIFNLESVTHWMPLPEPPKD